LRVPGAPVRKGVLALALLVLAIAGGRAIDASARRQIPVWPSLAQFDLAAISVASGTLHLPPFMHGPALDPADLAQAFRPWSNTPMLHGTRAGLRDPFEPPFEAAQLDALRTAWLDAIRQEPRAWLAHRLALRAQRDGRNATFVERYRSPCRFLRSGTTVARCRAHVAMHVPRCVSRVDLLARSR
jgi:hypothetical protein